MQLMLDRLRVETRFIPHWTESSRIGEAPSSNFAARRSPIGSNLSSNEKTQMRTKGKSRLDLGATPS